MNSGSDRDVCIGKIETTPYYFLGKKKALCFHRALSLFGCADGEDLNLLPLSYEGF
ncbi:MAG: hypothetical protein HW415_895 [Deltaproteobacteria bacterium]|nr:hypothetical protein [Deltaproteobacteria bacterium]